MLCFTMSIYEDGRNPMRKIQAIMWLLAELIKSVRCIHRLSKMNNLKFIDWQFPHCWMALIPLLAFS